MEWKTINHIPNVWKNKEYIRGFYDWDENEGDIGKFYDS